MRVHLLHGAVGGAGDWDAFVALLEGVEVKCHDLYAGEILPFDRMGVALCEEADEGDVLIGYSMGGRLAMHAIVQPGAPWAKAMIISADPGSGTDVERIERDCEWAALVRADWGRFCDQWSRQPVFGGAEMPWARDDGSGERREAIARGFEEWSVGRQRDLRDELAALETPLQWIVGAEDEKFVRLAASLENIAVSVVHDAGHRVPWDQPEVVANAIQSFLS